MADFTQDGRPMAVTTPLGKDVLLLERLYGGEALSELFSYQLELLSQVGKPAVAFDKLIGQSVTVVLRNIDDKPLRYINGVVSRFSQGGVVRGTSGAATFTRYTATLVPSAWKLTRTRNSRIFQQLAVPDILKTVFAGLTVKFKLGTYEPRDFCTQYMESDFAFASRLMEEEGIYYYFTHADSSHTLVIADTPGGHDAVPGGPDVRFDDTPADSHAVRPVAVHEWVKTQELQAGKVTLWDHCFELPPQNLEASKPTQASVAVGAETHQLGVGGNDKLEVYEYPGRFAQRFDGIDPSGGERSADVSKITQDNKRAANVRMQQEAVGAVSIAAAGTVRGLTAGHKFKLTDLPKAAGEYVIRRLSLTADLSAEYHNDRQANDGEVFGNRLEVLPLALPFRPPLATPKGRIHGVQAATVVGPKSEEIFTDKYGRVKVQFRWDREGKEDAKSSCWVRVGSIWAGKQWGAIHIPRIGQEVLVAFEEGDPDRPVIVGSVYNAEQMPPYPLPDNRTKSGLKSRSSLKGGPDHFNEFRFEDKKGSEQVYLHAEKDFDVVVENNQTSKIGFREADQTADKGDQTLTVFNNRSVTVGGGKGKAADGSELVHIWNNQELFVGDGKGQNTDGSQKVTIWKDRTVDIKTGKDTLTVHTGDQTETLKMGNRTVLLEMGNDALTLKLGNRTTKLNLGADSTEAMQSITLKVGQSKVVVDQMGVKIEGMMISINGQVQTKLAGLMTEVSGTAMCKLGGGITMIG